MIAASFGASGPSSRHVEGPDTRSVAGMVTKRWTRYGKDRLYVSLSDGTQVGWVDLLAGEERIPLPKHAAEFRRTVAELAQGRQMTPRGQPTGVADPAAEARSAVAREVPSHETAGAEPEGDAPVPAGPQPWVDLADRRPGEGVRERARAEWSWRR